MAHQLDKDAVDETLADIGCTMTVFPSIAVIAFISVSSAAETDGIGPRVI